MELGPIIGTCFYQFDYILRSSNIILFARCDGSPISSIWENFPVRRTPRATLPYNGFWRTSGVLISQVAFVTYVCHKIGPQRLKYAYARYRRISHHARTQLPT